MNNQQAINLLKGLEQSLDDYCELNDEGKTAFRMAITALESFGISEQLPSAQPEPCEDAVSRRRLLSDLKELTAAWGKYPVMAEQIKGVETAIGYVETIPSVKPEREKGKWIPRSERLPEYGKTVLWCNDKGSIFTTAITYMNGTSWAVGKRHRRCQVVAWMPLPEPYGGDQNG